MKTWVFETKMMSPLGIRETFSVFENPYNLARITPPWLNFTIETQDLEMRRGALIDYKLRWMGLPMRWRTLITEYERPFLFVDEMLNGPYSLWRHRHTFRETADGTEVGDRVEYAIPFGPVGRLAHALAVRRQVEEIFAYRQKALQELFAEAATVSRAGGL